MGSVLTLSLLACDKKLSQEELFNAFKEGRDISLYTDDNYSTFAKRSDSDDKGIYSYQEEKESRSGNKYFATYLPKERDDATGELIINDETTVVIKNVVDEEGKTRNKLYKSGYDEEANFYEKGSYVSPTYADGYKNLTPYKANYLLNSNTNKIKHKL